MFSLSLISRSRIGLLSSRIVSQQAFYNTCPIMKIFKTALIQMNVGKDKDLNLEHAKDLIETAAREGAKVICLPECFNSPYGTQFFKEYSEDVPDGPTCKALSKMAKSLEIYLVGGSIPEKAGDKIYNTCTIWSPSGALLAKYRKMHLFDINIPDGITFKESEILSAGSEISVFEIGAIKVGIGLCYDLRFEELAKIYRKEGCHILIYPAAFNMTTGPLHWMNLQIGRAIDNQVFVFAISPARGDKGYIAWGHSQITSPWGKVLAQAEDSEEIIYAIINLDECEKVRQQIPIFSQRRTDIYDTTLRVKSNV